MPSEAEAIFLQAHKVLGFARTSLSTEFILSACKAVEGLEKGGSGQASII
jgi:hypothetical protein